MSKTPSNPAWGPRTRAVRGGTRRSPHGETSEALFLNSGFAYPDAGSAERRFLGQEEGFIYGRFGNPTTSMFEERLALIEGADGVVARATATGLAAVQAAMMCQLRAGDHVVAARALFGGCRWIVEELLPRFGVGLTLVDGEVTDQWERALRPETKVFFLETPANPGLEICDLKAIARIAHGAGARLVVDNVFATPVFQKPFEHGADVVVYSATKHIDGQGRCLGGAILARPDFVADHLQIYLRNTGPAMSPFNAWVLLKSLETLELRVRAMAASAEAIAARLKRLRGVARVRYPFDPDHPQAALARAQMTGGGTLVTFDVEGGRDAAFAFANALELIDVSNNLGDAKTLITHPATTTHGRMGPEERAKIGIAEGTLRLSVGLEDAEDLVADLERGAEAAARL